MTTAVGRRGGRRGARRFESGDRSWLALEAWRAASGHGLLYLLPLEGDAPSADDRADRRALLEPGQRLAEMEDRELERRLDDGAPLTVTERRLADGEGGLWLVQSVGPVWAEDEVASGLTGLVFTRLDGSRQRVRTAGGDVAESSERALLARLRRAVADALVSSDDGTEPDERDEGDEGEGGPSGSRS